MKNNASASDASRASCQKQRVLFGEFDVLWQVKSLGAASVNYP